MKSLKLLFISFTVTFVSLLTISPAVAEPLIKVQQLKVSDHLTTQLEHYNIIQMPSRLSTSLTFSSLSQPSAKDLPLTMNVVSRSNDFFTSAMVFNDKLHQLISYFTAPSNKSISKPVPSSSKEEAVKEKCSSTLSFS